jgi:hypothetical protein
MRLLRQRRIANVGPLVGGLDLQEALQVLAREPQANHSGTIVDHFDRVCGNDKMTPSQQPERKRRGRRTRLVRLSPAVPGWLGGAAFGVGKVTVDQRKGELLLPAHELEPVPLELVAPGLARACNACRSATSKRTAVSMHSTLAIDDRRLVSV